MNIKQDPRLKDKREKQMHVKSFSLSLLWAQLLSFLHQLFDEPGPELGPGN